MIWRMHRTSIYLDDELAGFEATFSATGEEIALERREDARSQHLDTMWRR
jgi:hypothetical protein